MKELNFDEIMSDIPISLVLENYGIRINKYQKCCCPFHDDRNPSAIIKGNKLYCYACGKQFDVIDVAKRFGAEKPLKEAAAIAGIDILDYIYDNGLPYKEHKAKKNKKLKMSEFNKFCALIGLKNSPVIAISGSGPEKCATLRDEEWIIERVKTKQISSNPLWDMFESDTERLSFLYDKYIDFRNKLIKSYKLACLISISLQDLQISYKIPYITEIPKIKKISDYARTVVEYLDKRALEFFQNTENRSA